MGSQIWCAMKSAFHCTIHSKRKYRVVVPVRGTVVFGCTGAREALSRVYGYDSILTRFLASDVLLPLHSPVRPDTRTARHDSRRCPLNVRHSGPVPPNEKSARHFSRNTPHRFYSSAQAKFESEHCEGTLRSNREDHEHPPSCHVNNLVA